MAYRGPDGNLISADSAVELSEYSQERVPEEEVLYFACYSTYSLLVESTCYFLVNEMKFVY